VLTQKKKTHTPNINRNQLDFKTIIHKTILLVDQSRHRYHAMLVQLDCRWTRHSHQCCSRHPRHPLEFLEIHCHYNHHCYRYHQLNRFH
jgi:hypothetical protein